MTSILQVTKLIFLPPMRTKTLSEAVDWPPSLQQERPNLVWIEKTQIRKKIRQLQLWPYLTSYAQVPRQVTHQKLKASWRSESVSSLTSPSKGHSPCLHIPLKRGAVSTWWKIHNCKRWRLATVPSWQAASSLLKIRSVASEFAPTAHNSYLSFDKKAKAVSLFAR